MKQIIVKTIGKRTDEDPLKVDLPSYQVIEFLPEKRAKIYVPDDEVDNIDGVITLSKAKIRLKYRGQKWDNPNVTDDVVI